MIPVAVIFPTTIYWHASWRPFARMSQRKVSRR